MAKSMLMIAELRRKDRYKIDYRLGHFVENNRKFVEGEILTQLRAEIAANEKRLEKVEEQKKLTAVHSSEHLCLQSAQEFHSRELQELRKELEHKELEMKDYKERLKLAEKEERC
jgi:hypothetical protein